MARVIILEGIDGAGKSTLADKLEAAVKLRHPEANVIRLHRGPMKGTVHDELVQPILDLGENDVLIADRWHVGEMIYGPIYRGHSFVRSVIGDLEAFLDLHKAIRIVVSPPISVVRQRLAERGEDYLQPEHVDQVHAFYEAFATVFGYLKIDQYDIEILDEIVSDLFEEEKVAC